MVRESLNKQATRIDQANQTVREDRPEIKVKRVADRYSETSKQDNFALLEEGPHENLNITKSDGILSGLPGASARGGLFQSVTSTVNNLIFQGGVQLVGSQVIFSQCRFEQEVGMDSTSKAHFIGCLFNKSGVVNNSGVAGNAFIIGCHRTSGLAHTNVTIIAETT